MQCEEEERGGEDADSDNPDPFIQEGLSSTDDDSDTPLPRAQRTGARLSDAKIFRQRLKEKLFRSKEKRAQHRAERRAQGLI